MLQIPPYISIVFILAMLYSIFMFWKATGYSRAFILILSAWLLIQGIAGYNLFYTQTQQMPPRFLLLVGPWFLGIIILFMTAKGRKFLDRLHTPTLVLMNAVRIPVELVLLWLFLNKAVPQIMTFEGNNLDIISGLTAPVIWYFTRRQNNRRLLLAWNILCLALLVNIVVTAVLAAPFRFQQIAFDQPNIGVLYFPFVWLPGIVVPLVLLSHLAMIRKIALRQREVMLPASA